MEIKDMTTGALLQRKRELELVLKPESTADYIHIPVRECKITATIDISVKEGIKAYYCGEEKEIATYLFAKEKGWTMEKAKAWVKEHAKSISQAEITDELDYLDLMIKEAGLNDENKTKLSGIAESHISVQIKAEATIRDAITPIIKLLTDGFSSEEKCYKACKEALEGIMQPTMPEPMNPTVPEKSLREYLKEEIQKHLMEVK